MRTVARLSPVPLILAGALAAAAVVFSRGAGGTPRAAVLTPSSPPPTAAASPSPSAPPTLPACSAGSAPAPNPGYGQWRVTLLDTRYRLPRGYAPPGLTPTSGAGFASEFEVRSLVLPNLEALRRAAAAGHPLAIVAAYRSFDQQRELLKVRKKELGAEVASRRVARPGHSEHQLGTAVDFTSLGLTDVSPSWGRSPAGRWMSENAWRFGFVLSYPQGKQAATCYGYEPWHFRYVGPKLAAKVHDSGLMLREYLWRLASDASSAP